MKYDSFDEKYSGLEKTYIMESDTKTNFSAMIDSYDIKCVALASKTANKHDYVVFCGFIFYFNTDTNQFERQSIKGYTRYNKDGKKQDDKNSDSTAHSNITNVNKERDEGIIIDTVVGNFDENTNGQEQIIMLHYNEWWTHSDYIYLTQCYMDDKGDIYVSLNQIFNNSEDKRSKLTPTYPSICAVDVLNHGIKLEYIKSDFTYMDPVILAVLSAPPYYEELADQSDALGNVGTSFGNISSTENSSSDGVTVSAGVIFGYEEDIPIIEVGFELEAEISNSFTGTWSESTSVETSVTYTNYFSDDAVVLMVIPYDTFYYRMTVWNSKKGAFETTDTVMGVPYTPLTTMMTVKDYNKVASLIDNAPVISDYVLKHTVGDPRSYPDVAKNIIQTSDFPGDIKKIPKDDASQIMYNGKTIGENPFRGSGYGNVSTEQSITTSKSKSKSFDYSIDINVTSKVKVAGFVVGTSLGAGYNHNVSVTSTEGTVYSGSVAGVPVSDYQFRWALVTYTVPLFSSSGTYMQICPVINYLCQPLGSDYPAKVPENLSLISHDIDKITIGWDKAEGAQGYMIYRSEDDIKYEEIATIDGYSSVKYTDTNVIAGKDYYYYYVKAFNNNKSTKTIASKILYAPALTVTDLEIKRQPKLSYREYENLDLSNLVVSLILDNGTSVDVPYSDFDKYNLSVNMQDGVELDSSINGNPLTIKYASSGLLVYTNNLTVKEVGNYPLLLTVNFTVGDKSNATYLEAGKQLVANINLENTTDIDTSALVILALYDKDMTMVSHNSATAKVNAGGSIDVKCSLSLPSNVRGYTAKVLVWDGTDITTSKLIPLSDTAQISY